MTTSNEDRPGVASEATRVHEQANTLSVSSDARLVALLDGAFVVVVDLDEDRHTRRVYLNLPSAQRAAERAQDRGHTAVVALARLDVVGVIE